MKKFMIFLSMLALLGACKNRQNNTSVEGQYAGMHRGEAREVLQTSEYTYLLLTGKEGEQWVAVPKMEAESGQTYYYKDGLEMPNFTSKELNRQFSSVLFLESVYTTPPAESGTPAMGMSQSPGAITTEKQDINIEPGKGIIPLSELFENHSSFSGKEVRVRGKVVKFSPAIMGKNWIHIQDGTEYNGKYDLTVTTSAVVKTGDTVTLEGKITLNKDFGYGYKYDVLMEDANVTR